MFLVSISMKIVSYFIEIDSHYDLLFESNTLFITLYIYFVSRKAIQSNPILQLGILLLVFNKIYDVVTEIKVLDTLADEYEFIDTFLEDGILQVSFLLIAFGITGMIKKVHHESSIDELTGLFNRKKLSEINKQRFDIIYIDLNNLKKVNDSKGHAVGDLLLIRFSQALTIAKESGEQVFRLGGDEFLVIADVGRTQRYVDSIHKILEGETITFSYGSETTTLEGFEQALIRADKAMYKMKNSQSNEAD
ncbi:GGDEF domain-containing protein [Vibrio kyushuensis]|uniref:GGDEF domain-containing protein n=1 Tax=Vibrio kyushuensis TaxID=2910249 RepID=UPI003D0ADC44